MSANPPKIDPARQALIYALDPTKHFNVLKESPDDWQQSALLLRCPKINTIICTSRQAGKSTVISVKAANKAIYTTDALVLVLAPTERQSKELFLKIKKCIKATPGAPAILKENAKEIELSNGSRIVCLPGKAENVAGYSAPALVIIDEACYAKDNLYNTVSPMLAISKGELVLISTPFIRSGFFYDIWSDIKDESWLRIEIPATKVPRITPEFLAKERRRLGEWWFMSQYMCKFQEAQDSLITEDMIERAFHRKGEKDYKPLILTGPDPLYTRKTYESILL